MNTKNSRNSESVQDFKYLIGMALQNKISWKALGSLLDEMTSTLKKSKEVNKILLEQLQSLQVQWKIQTNEIEAGEVIQEEEKTENDSKSGEDSYQNSGVLDEEDFDIPDYDYKENDDKNYDDLDLVCYLLSLISLPCGLISES